MEQFTRKQDIGFTGPAMHIEMKEVTYMHFSEIVAYAHLLQKIKSEEKEVLSEKRNSLRHMVLFL